VGAPSIDINFFRRFPILGGFFVSRYPYDPDPQVDKPRIPEGCRTDWDAWQFSSTGDGPAHGCQEPYVDLDVFHGTEEELQAFLGIEEPQPAPAPEPTELELALIEIMALKKEKAELMKRASTVVSAAGELAELL